MGATRSCVHISSRAVTHSRGERVLSWGQHLCSPAKKARLALWEQAAVQHSMLCAASLQARMEENRQWAQLTVTKTNRDVVQERLFSIRSQKFGEFSFQALLLMVSLVNHNRRFYNKTHQESLCPLRKHSFFFHQSIHRNSQPTNEHFNDFSTLTKERAEACSCCVVDSKGVRDFNAACVKWTVIFKLA